MKAFSVLLLVGVLAAQARSADVTFTMWPQTTDGVNFCSFGSYIITAGASSDNGGIASYGFDLLTGVSNLRSRAPAGYFDPADPESALPRKTVGFDVSLLNTSSGRLDASQLTAFPDNIPVYRVGQTPGILSTLAPPEYGPFQSSNTNGSTYKSPIIIASGTIGGFYGGPAFDRTSVFNTARVYDDQTGIETIAANVRLTEVIFEHFPDVRISNSVGCFNSVDGGVLVPGAVSTLSGLPVTRSYGGAPIAGFTEPGSFFYVMANIAGPMDYILNASSFDVGPSDPEYARLHELFPFWNVLYKFPNTAGPKVFTWDFVAAPAPSVVALAVVPEPTSLTLAAVAMMFASRRRRA
jgi:hypothetical protein